MSADIFISYKSEEEAYARRVRKVLEDNGMSCWMAPDSIPVGSNYMKQIPQAIESCKVMIVLVSEKSQKSTWVKNEFSQAISKNKLIIPYVIQDCKLEDEFAFSMSTMQQVFAWKNEEDALERIVKDIREVLGNEENAKIEISVVKKPKVTPYIIAGVALVAVVGMLFFLLNKPKTETPVAASAEVYYSEVLPYYLTGYYQDAEEAKRDAYATETYEKAFSLLSFIRNDTDKSVFVEKIACDIDEVIPIQKPVIQVDGLFVDDTFSFYAFNDGWGDGNDLQAEWTIEAGENALADNELVNALTGSSKVTVKSGEAVQLLKYKADLSDLLEYCRSKKGEYIGVLYTLYAEVKYENRAGGCAMYLMYDEESDSLIVDYGGIDDEKPSITLFGILDVDNPPSTIRFLSEDANPLVEDTYRIETVIIPTKSCQVTLNGSYSIGGELYETDDYTVKVIVPYFKEEAYMLGGGLTRKLNEIDMNNTTQMKKLCEQYRYDIESILPDDAPRG